MLIGSDKTHIKAFLSGEYGDKYIILTGLNENQKENIEVALERKELAVMAEMGNGKRIFSEALITISKRLSVLLLKKTKSQPVIFLNSQNFLQTQAGQDY